MRLPLLRQQNSLQFQAGPSRARAHRAPLSEGGDRFGVGGTGSSSLGGVARRSRSLAG